MSDRFNGDVIIGGRMSEAVFSRAEDLLLPLLEGDLDDGAGIFYECNGNDFNQVRTYCRDHGVALAIYWDAKYEYGPSVEFLIGGKSQSFDTDSNGRIIISVDELESSKHLSIPEFIASLDIPEFPSLEIIDE